MLDERQHKAVQLLAKGMTQAEIAGRIGVSTRQVGRVLTEARKAVGVRTSQQLVAWYFQRERGMPDAGE